MAKITLYVDRDLVRAGLDLSTLEADDVVVETSERLAAETIFVVVVSYLGMKLLDFAVNEGLRAAFDKLVDFTRSREKKLRIEIEDHEFDERVKLYAKVETMDRDEFEAALSGLEKVRIDAEALIAEADEPLQDAWYVWQDNEWVFSYYTTETGEIVDER